MFSSRKVLAGVLSGVVALAVGVAGAQETPPVFRAPGDPVEFPLHDVKIPGNDMVFVQCIQIRGVVPLITLDDDAVLLHRDDSSKPLVMMHRKTTSGNRTGPPRVYTAEEVQKGYGRSPFIQALHAVGSGEKKVEDYPQRYRKMLRKAASGEIDTSWPALGQLYDRMDKAFSDSVNTRYLEVAEREGVEKAKEAVLEFLKQSPLVDQGFQPYFTTDTEFFFRAEGDHTKEFYWLPNPGSPQPRPETPAEFRHRATSQITFWIDTMAAEAPGFFRFDSRNTVIVSGWEQGVAAQQAVLLGTTSTGLGHAPGVNKWFIDQTLKKNPKITVDESHQK